MSLLLVVTEPRQLEWVDDMDRRIQQAIESAAKQKIVISGSKVVVITGWRPGAGHSNTMRIVDVPSLSDLKKKDSFPVLRQPIVQYED